MPRRSLFLVAALCTLLSCRDDPISVEPPTADQTAPPTVDPTLVRSRLDHPLVLELVGDLSDRGTARKFRNLISALATPLAKERLGEVHRTFGEVVNDLTTERENDEDEIQRAILGLIVEEAQVVLESLEKEKGS
jgi:hypothetical protein